MDERQPDLSRKILEEMTVDYSSNLEKNFEFAKQFIRITREGTVDVLVKDKVSGTDQVLLYLVGKLYAKEAGLTTNEAVGNIELMEQLGMPRGSLFPWLKQLRDEKKIKQVSIEKTVYHRIPVNLVEGTLKAIGKKVHSTS